ncbi:MAG: sodium:alanine symporter family protein [Nitrospinota bacterium]|nr:sodium:alanine symporter family protein [Nitrospinota bacterium]
MGSLTEITGSIAGFFWGTPMIVLLGFTSIYLTVGMRFIQFRKLFQAFKILYGSINRSAGKKGDISPMQALTTALSATVGTGNIAGVATAITAGGPGALFWMWIMGLVGMGTKFAEILLSLQYRGTDSEGRMVGGPMYYIEHGLGSRKLAVMFALCGVAASFGPGNMVQSHSIAVAVKDLFGVAPLLTGLVSAFCVALIILGGIVRIGRVTEALVPFMAGFYILGGLIILIMNIAQLPSAIWLILESAFSPVAATGGFAGATVKEALRFGVARGVFSNEAGLGSAPIAHAAAKTDKPSEQALIGMLGVFIDTLVICSITGLVIVVTGMWQSEFNGAELTMRAFDAGMPGSNYGGKIVSFGLILFAFTTFIGWSYYGLQCVEYLLGLKTALAYRWVFVGVIVLGSQLKLDLIWNIVDIMVAMMAIPNLIALLGMSRMIFKTVNDGEDLR